MKVNRTRVLLNQFEKVDNLMKMAGDKSKRTIEDGLGCGYYQVFHYCVFQWITISLACNMTFMVFGKVVPKSVCIEWESNATLASDSNNSKLTCAMMKNDSCLKFDHQTDFYSIIPEWNLICDRSKLVFLSMSIQMVGVLIGSPIGGQMSDWFGRKWILVGSTASMLLLGSLSALSPNIEVFIALRFCVGFSCGFVIVTNYVLMNEFLTAKHRLWVTNLGGWPVGFAFLALFAYLTRDWRKLTVVCNLVSIPSIFLLLFMPESVYWSTQKGKLAQAERSLAFVARLNKTKNHNQTEMADLMAPSVVQVASKEGKEKVHGFWDLFTHKEYCIPTIVLSFSFFSISTISYGILFDADRLVGNRFLNFFFLASMRCVSSGLTILVDKTIKKCGRKLTFILPAVLISFCCVVITTLTILKSNGTVIMIVSILASMLTSPVWTAIWLSNTEIYPTAIRNVSLGCTSMFNRLGGILAPQILFLAYQWPPLPYVIFAVLAIISCILYALFIPETKNRSLPHLTKL